MNTAGKYVLNINDPCGGGFRIGYSSTNCILIILGGGDFYHY